MEETSVHIPLQDLDKICYTCLSGDNLVCVPKNHQEYDDLISLFFKFTSLKITEDVVSICENCVSKLNESHQFRETCIESYLALQNIRKGHMLEGSTHIKQEKVDQYQISNENNVDNNETSLNSNACNENMQLSDVKDNVEFSIDKNKECKKAIYIQTEKNSTESIREPTLNDTAKHMVCGICSLRLENALEIHNHFLEVHKEEQDQPEEFEDWGPTEGTESDEQNYFACSHCEKTFSSFVELKIHLSDTGAFKCRFCYKSFMKYSSFEAHKKIHTGTYICQVCPLCEKRFSSRTLLNRHFMTHTGNKPFECSLCPSKFYGSGDLNIHMRVHTGEKPYKCSYCGKYFRRTSHLTVHLRTHTGEKPYSCRTCDKSFAQSGDLSCHERIHSGERPFNCHICEKAFVQGSALKTHLKKHAKMTCSGCSKIFTSFRMLREHRELCQDVESKGEGA